LKSATVTREASRWYVALSYEIPDPPPPLTAAPENPVGIDLGLTHLATLSNGETVDPPRYFRRAELRLAREQRRLARKRPGSRRRWRQRLRVAECHAKILRQRRDFAHRLTSHWASRHDLIAFEDLDIRRMARGWFGKSLSDGGWGMLRAMTRYKTALRSGRYVEVPAEGTTQTCSECGRRADPPMELGERIFRCPAGHSSDRDVNASRNVLARGLTEVGPKRAEHTRGEREPPPGRVGRRAYQRRRAPSWSREEIAGERGLPEGGSDTSPRDSRPQRWVLTNPYVILDDES
jgi:putative transposase